MQSLPWLEFSVNADGIENHRSAPTQPPSSASLHTHQSNPLVPDRIGMGGH
jgi:hypothetical protein